MAGSQEVRVAIIHVAVVRGLKEGVGSLGWFMHYIDLISKYLALFEKCNYRPDLQNSFASI